MDSVGNLEEGELSSIGSSGGTSSEDSEEEEEEEETDPQVQEKVGSKNNGIINSIKIYD